MAVPIPVFLLQRTQTNSFLALVLAEALFCRRRVRTALLTWESQRNVAYDAMWYCIFHIIRALLVG